MRLGRRRDLSGVTGEKGIWIPVEFWDGGDGRDGGDERDGKQSPGSENVKGKKALEAELEAVSVDEDGEMEMEMEAYGRRGVVERIWKELEKLGSVVQRKMEQMQKVKELGDGHDGDL